MKWLTLQTIKQQCRIEEDFHDEDELLTSYGESAEEFVLEYCMRTYGDLVDNYGKVPANLVNASKLLVALSYEMREPASAQNMSVVPYGNIDMLLKPYMRLAGSKDGDAADEVQTITKGSDAKIVFTADLPDGLKLSDIDFTVKVINYSEPNKEHTYQKAECIEVYGGKAYVALVDTDELGIGYYMLRLTVYIPDTDYPSGTRKEVIKINPQVKVVA